MNLVERLRSGYTLSESQVNEAANRIEQLEAEVIEQCRLNGIGSEREAALLGKVERLEAHNAVLRDALDGARKSFEWIKSHIGVASSEVLEGYAKDCVYETNEAIASTPEYSLADIRQAEWQPIETAPKDGSEVLLYLGNHWNKVEKARWYEPWKNWQAGTIPADPAREEYGGIGSALPTHWMPLPNPPAIMQMED